MPMYEYQCKECDHQYEELVFKSDAKVPCPQCGSDRTCKLVSAFASKSLAKGSECHSGSCHKSGFG